MTNSSNTYQSLLQERYKLDRDKGAVTSETAAQLIEAGQAEPLDGTTLLLTTVAMAMIIGGVLLSLVS